MTALVIGGGPAGLMAGQALAEAGRRVIVADHKPSLARKFLMAGKSGLNLTKREDAEAFNAAYSEGADALRPMLDAFGPREVEAWAEGLGQELFAGSTGRVFPRAMKASPLLRVWLGRLDRMGVEMRTRWRFTGWDGAQAIFETPDGAQAVTPSVTVLALGGASWRRLGSDGAWAAMPALAPHAAPFQPSNVGLCVDWTDHMTPHLGKPIKAVRWSVHGPTGEIAASRGEAVMSQRGLEGGGIYPLIPALRQSDAVHIDFAPNQMVEHLIRRLPQTPKAGLKRILRNTLRWPPEKIALFNELAQGLAIPLTGPKLAHALKSMPLRHGGTRPLDEAISTAGGLRFEALTGGLELRDRPGVFACGEMLDWDAPTGGYLLTACLATGLWAGRHAACHSG